MSSAGVPPVSPGAWDAVSAAMAATAVAVPVSPRRMVPSNLMCLPLLGQRVNVSMAAIRHVSPRRTASTANMAAA